MGESNGSKHTTTGGKDKARFPVLGLISFAFWSMLFTMIKNDCKKNKVIYLRPETNAKATLEEMAEALPEDSEVFVLYRLPGCETLQVGANISNQDALWMLEETRHKMMAMIHPCACDLEYDE